TYKRMGNLQAAEREFRALTQDRQFGAAAHRNLGLLHDEAGDYDGAIAFLQTALSLQPSMPEAHHDLGLAYLHKGLALPAIDEFRTALAEAPEFELAAVALSQTYQKVGKIDEARQILTDYLEKYPDRDSPEL